MASALVGPAAQVYHFDFSTAPNYGITLFVGGTESGKSSGLVTWLYNQRNDFDVCIVFCDSMDDVMNYEQIAPGCFVFEGYHGDVIERVYAIQQQNTRDGVETRVALVIDDCGFDKKALRNDKQLARLASNGRHARFRTYLAIQEVTQLGPDVRKAAKHVCLAKEKRPPYKKRIYEYFNPCFKTYDEFEAVFDAVAQDNRQMVMYMFQGSNSNEIVDNVWWFKPQWPWPKFRIPTPERRRGKAVWTFHQSWVQAPPPPTATGVRHSKPPSKIIQALSAGGSSNKRRRLAPPAATKRRPAAVTLMPLTAKRRKL